MKHAEVSEQIIKAYYKVYNALGYGFLEKVYENALYHELVAMGLTVERQKKIRVHYYGNVVGNYYADLVVNNVIIVEVKAQESLLVQHENQLTNYLKATTIEVGLLLNFGPNTRVKRKIFDNDKKLMLEEE